MSGGDASYRLARRLSVLSYLPTARLIEADALPLVTTVLTSSPTRSFQVTRPLGFLSWLSTDAATEPVFSRVLVIWRTPIIECRKMMPTAQHFNMAP